MAPSSKLDDFFASETFRKIAKALHQTRLLDILLRLTTPIYARVNKFDPKKLRIFAIGQSHLDSAWNWRWMPDTAPYKLSHTVGYNLDRLKRFPPRRPSGKYFGGYKFSFPAAAHYEYIERTWPKAFSLLKKYVKEGRWELLGGMWVESDCNVPDGESFVRQRLYGQRYYMEKFGKKAVISWLPDSFGFAHSLPQILVKSGAIGFHTTKITWNMESVPGTGGKFPFHWFYWQGPDGSILLSSNIKNGWRGLEQLGDVEKLARMLDEQGKNDTHYCYSKYPDINRGKSTGLSEKYIPYVLWPYGQGDGGHGPMDVEVFIADTLERIGFLQLTKAGVVYKLIEREFGDKIPVWNDELYLERHRGVQTTLHSLKRQNRIAETRLKIQEMIFTFFMKSRINEYPHEIFDTIWKKVLFNQFHDILPGTSIQEVYEDTDSDYLRIVLPGIYKLLDKITYTLAGMTQSLYEKEVYQKIRDRDNEWLNSARLVYFSSIHHTIPIKLTLIDEELKDIPFAELADDKIEEILRENEGLTAYLKNNIELSPIYINKEPGIGFFEMDLNYISKQIGIHYNTYPNRTDLPISYTLPERIGDSWSGPIEIEYNKTKITLDPYSGSITAISVKNDDSEDKNDGFTIKGILNVLKLFKEDAAKSDAWDIDPFYRKNLIGIFSVHNFHVNSYHNRVELSFKGAVSDNAEGTLRYIFTPYLPYIEVILDIDWNEPNGFLRVEFESDLQAQSYETGIPYGAIKRPTIPMTELERGRWEAPGQLYFTIYDDARNNGLSLLVFDRYGFNSISPEGILEAYKDIRNADFDVKGWIGAMLSGILAEIPNYKGDTAPNIPNERLSAIRNMIPHSFKIHNLSGISLLRGVKYGDPTPKDARWFDPETMSVGRKRFKDMGRHRIRWAILPFASDPEEASIREHAYAFSHPSYAWIIPGKRWDELKNDFNELKNLNLKIEGEKVTIPSIKAGYGGSNDIILRAFGLGGRSGAETAPIKIESGFFKSANVYECDLLEFPLRDSNSEDSINDNGDVSSISLEIKPFEIKTLMISENKPDK